jgi:cullin 1
VLRIYFIEKANIWIQNESTPSYLERVERILEDERSRVLTLFSPTSETKLLQTIDTELLQAQQSLLLGRESGIMSMLVRDSLSDLQRVYRLYSRVSGGLDAIADAFRGHIVNVCNEKIDQRVVRIEAESGASVAADDPQFVKDLIAVHGKYVLMVREQFMSHALFQKALKDAFSLIVNKNPNCATSQASMADVNAHDGKVKTAELIVTFCDRLLKSGSIEKLDEAEIESFLEKTVQLFTHLVDKDVFGEIYRNQLAKRLVLWSLSPFIAVGVTNCCFKIRLLNQRSASDDMERLFIGKLKLACGAQFTTRFEGMMNDLIVGQESSKAFETFCKENPEKLPGGKCEFSVQVLTTGHWPQYKPFQEVVLPHVMELYTRVFRDYYDSKASHRKLTWIHSLGTATIKGLFTKKPVELQVATLQAIVLLAFNPDSLGGPTNSPVLFGQLQEMTVIPEDVLKKILHSLSCGKFKILTKLAATHETDVKAGGVIKTTDSFAFNEHFVCNMNKIRIPIPSLEDNQSNKKVEEDRSNAIEAAAVRIMKVS